MKAKFAHIDSHIFMGKRYRIVWRSPRRESICPRCGQATSHQSDGECDPPHVFDKAIMIGPKLSEPELLETAVHEAMHATCWFADEEVINQAAMDIALFLSRIGFRLSDTVKEK